MMSHPVWSYVPSGGLCQGGSLFRGGCLCQGVSVRETLRQRPPYSEERVTGMFSCPFWFFQHKSKLEGNLALFSGLSYKLLNRHAQYLQHQHLLMF